MEIDLILAFQEKILNDKMSLPTLAFICLILLLKEVSVFTILILITDLTFNLFPELY